MLLPISLWLLYHTVVQLWTDVLSTMSNECNLANSESLGLTRKLLTVVAPVSDAIDRFLGLYLIKGDVNILSLGSALLNLWAEFLPDPRYVGEKVRVEINVSGTSFSSMGQKGHPILVQEEICEIINFFMYILCILNSHQSKYFIIDICMSLFLLFAADRIIIMKES